MNRNNRQAKRISKSIKELSQRFKICMQKRKPNRTKSSKLLRKSAEKNSNWLTRLSKRNKSFNKLNNKMCMNSRELQKRIRTERSKRKKEEQTKSCKKLNDKQIWPKLNYSKPIELPENRLSKNKKNLRKNSKKMITKLPNFKNIRKKNKRKFRKEKWTQTTMTMKSLIRIKSRLRKKKSRRSST